MTPMNHPGPLGKIIAGPPTLDDEDASPLR